ncbi:MAG TPA: type II toxin-antitoxin system CcdA family antitoxin [Kofleriaceae bacterium]|nr:type II toxin-antitoxin system CcdA family antitoxin [Kofleriaceae bacterium]
MKSAIRQAQKPQAAQRSRRAAKAKDQPALPQELVDRAKALGLDVSAVTKAALEAAILKAERTADRARFLAENDAAIDQCNAIVEKYGVFGDDVRLF